MNRKNFLVLLLGIILSIVLMACGNDKESATSDDANAEESDSASNKEEVTLNFWVFGATNYEELAKEYEENNPEVKINVKTSETDEHHDSLFTSISTGSGAPDIAMLEIDQLDRFKEAKDSFVNLYDVGSDDVKDQYLDWKWEIGENPEHDFLYGMPTDIGPKAMYYRIDVFEEAGLPIEPDEVEGLIKTREAFLEAGDQIKEKTGKPMVDNMEMAYRMILDGAEQSFFDEEDNLLIEESGNAVKEAYEFAVEMNERELVGNFEMWTPEWGNAVNNGDFAMEIGAAWLKGWMMDNAPEAEGQFRIATLPSEFAGNWGGSYIAIPNETKYPEAAYEFVEWLVSPENQLVSFTEEGLFPSAESVYEMDEFQNSTDSFFGGQSTANYFAKAAQDIPFTFKGIHYKSANDEVLNALINVQQGAAADEEWDAAVKRIKSLIDR